MPSTDMADIFWQEYPDNGPVQHLNGPCMAHGRFDCCDCCPELSDDYDWSDDGEDHNA